MLKIQTMSHFSDNLRKKVEASPLSQGKVADAIGELRPNFNQVVSGLRSLSDEKLKKLASIPELGLTYEELVHWRGLDAYDKTVKEAGLDPLPPEEMEEEAEVIKIKLVESIKRRGLK